MTVVTLSGEPKKPPIIVSLYANLPPGVPSNSFMVALSDHVGVTLGDFIVPKSFSVLVREVWEEDGLRCKCEILLDTSNQTEVQKIVEASPLWDDESLVWRRDRIEVVAKLLLT